MKQSVFAIISLAVTALYLRFCVYRMVAMDKGRRVQNNMLFKQDISYITTERGLCNIERLGNEDATYDNQVHNLTNGADPLYGV